MIYAFTSGDGYYQFELSEGDPFPEWVDGLTPCAVMEAPAQDPKDIIKSKIDALEREQLMPRATREFMLLMMEAQFPAEALAANPGYTAVKAFDNQIKALRDRL